MFLRRPPIRELLTGTISVLVLLAAANGATAQQAFDWKKFSGSTVNVSLKKVPWTDFLLPHIAEFEALTGIKTRIEVLPENQQREKLTVALTSGGTDVDVYDTQRHNEGLKYFLAGWYDPIDKYLKDAGLDRTRIVKAEIVVTDHDSKPAFDEAWATWMPAGYGPVRSFVQSVMPEGDLIEIIVTVALPA